MLVCYVFITLKITVTLGEPELKIHTCKIWKNFANLGLLTTSYLLHHLRPSRTFFESTASPTHEMHNM